LTAVRRYAIQSERKGKNASLLARVEYHRQSGKSFEVLAEDGNDSIFRRVIHKVLAGEAEASRVRGDTEISSANYEFRLLGAGNLQGRNCYVLELSPRRKSKYLIAGKAWIDAQEFAVIRVEGRPSESLSFWVGKPYIVQTFCKVGDNWVLAANRSIADVRLIGRTEFTIESRSFETPVRTAALQRPR